MNGWLGVNKYYFLFITLCLLLSMSVKAEIIEGKVVKVADGDSLTLLASSNQQVKIRLAGIDTPERRQPFGNKAKQALVELAFQKQVIVEVKTIDRYGRIVGVVFVDGQNLNAELVRQGLGWVYRKYTKDRGLYELETRAKNERLGLWGDDAPIEPWLWRRGKR